MIGVIVRKNKQTHHDLTAAAKKINTRLDIIEYAKLNIQYLRNQVSISYKNINLNQYQAIYIKDAWRNVELSTLAAAYCKQFNTVLIDKAFVEEAPWLDRKSFEYLKLSQNSLPIIDSIFINQNQLNQVKKFIGYPCVAKNTFGSQGKEVHLIKNEQELIYLFKQYKKRLFVQKFIENEGDYRFFIIGEKLTAAMKRTRQDPDNFLNNLSQGAKASVYHPTVKEQQLAIKAAQALKYDIAGVDLIKDKGKMKIMEVNRSPVYTGLMKVSQTNIPLRIVEYLSSFSRN